MTVVISASDLGFHFVSEFGELLAPQPFFTASEASSNVLFQANQSTGFTNRGLLNSEGAQVEAVLAREAALPLDPEAGDTASLSLSGFAISRVGDGVETLIGSVDLGRPTEITASFQRADGSVQGNNADLGWIVAIGSQVADIVALTDFVFEGGDGIDIFNLDDVGLGKGLLNGRGGDDYLVGQEAGSVVHGGEGSDELLVSGGANTIFGGPGNDIVLFGGQSEAQRGFGGSGNDTINGGVGADQLRGGIGDDHIFGGKGNDLIRGGRGRDHIDGDISNDSLFGGSGNDVILGGRGKDFLKGGAGNDHLNGGAGADTIIGGLGNDVLTGGGKSDIFVFSPDAGKDRITDFKIGADYIRFDQSSLVFDDLIISQTSKGAVVEITEVDQVIILRGVDAVELTEDAFIF